MLEFIISVMLLASGDCEQGTLSQYAERPTLEVISNRSVPGRTAYTLPDDWQRYDGLIAVESCTDLGRSYHVVWGEYSGVFLAFDCSGHVETSRWMKRNRILGEVDFYTAREWGSIGRGMKNAIMCEVDQ